MKQKSLYLGLFGLMLGMFLAMLDGLIVGTALPTIVGELGGLNLLSWVVTAYLVAAAVTTPLWGKFGDMFGRKGMFIASIVIFLIGSALAGMSQDMGQLIAFRAVQGLGAGGLMVGAFAIIAVLVPPRESGRLQSIIGVMMPVAFVGGPLLGGLLTDYFSWRWTFYVNLPLGAIALLIIATQIRLKPERIKARIDYAGAALLTIAIVALTLLASWAGTTYAWASPQILGLGVVAAASIAAFVWVERRAEEPVIPPRLFANRNFTLSQILSFLAGAAMMTLTNYLPQYMQFVQGASPTTSGLLLLPLMFGMLTAQLTIGHLITRNGKYRLYPILGGGLLVVGALSLLLLTPSTGTAVASALTITAGAGMGLVMQSAMLLTMTSADRRDMGAASGTVNLLRTIGGSLGIALLGAVYVDRLASDLTASLGPGEAHRLVDAGAEMTPALLHTLPDAVRDAYAAAVTNGLHGIVIGIAVVSLIAFAFAWFIREVPLPKDSPTDSPAGVPADGATEGATGVPAASVKGGTAQAGMAAD
ncbi:drug resistance transporter, EmrB/QacA subfamily [Sinosporangium album]|uniref:Drug resistance transporter, EmrB/QacA subfamily n=1 Tax=Sinosporangium album TaxID=504805 RepID=A0A1G8GBJ2_9ACTN|nr:MDR family MFS transporter [Sinosporangium album]SDH91758.1 drug resistance transporter, EmrB/QacA subfamily [Sinosporangium album]